MNTTSIYHSMSLNKNLNYFNYPVVSPPLTPVTSPSTMARQSRKSKSQKKSTDSNNHKHVCQFDFCGWSFKRYEHLKRHMLVHTGERPYQCQFLNCGKTFSRSDNFHAHYRTHTKIKNCATYAKRKSAAATPVSAAVTHCGVTDGHYPYIANQQNQTLIPPNSSLASSVATTAAALAVSQSQQVFYDGYLYDNHPTTSLELDPNFLQNIYTSPAETTLSSPFSLYNDEPPVVQSTLFDPFLPSFMPYASVSPIQPYPTKPHTCPLLTCSRQFKRLEHLKRHMRVHTLERPFSCSFPGCHKQFSRSDNLSQHYKTHKET